MFGNRLQHVADTKNKIRRMNMAKVVTKCLTKIGLIAVSFSALAQTQPGPPEVEEVVVYGVRESIEKSIERKKNADTIKDVITAEDIGQLPDENIAEALQRVTGIQMQRDDSGEGSSVQLRGLSNINVEMNGSPIAGSAANRNVNFQDIPSELFSAIEVMKTPSADRVEGALGGTINLETRRPLAGKGNFFGSLTGKAKYSEVSGETDPDVNLFVKKAWRDTSMGDWGVILNLGTKRVVTDHEFVAVNWLARPGTFTAVAGANNDIGSNLFHPNRGATTYAFDTNVDANGDGVSDANDRYYMFSGMNFVSRRQEFDRNSINATLQWQPNDRFDVYFDVTETTNDSASSSSRYAIETFNSRAALLESDRRDFSLLSNTPALGEVYVLNAGRVSNAFTRIGASPSLQLIDRSSTKYTLGGEWQVTDRFELDLEISTQEGKAVTREQGAITTTADFNGSGRVSLIDYTQLYDYDFDSSRIPNVTYYEAPFVAPAFGVDTEVSPENLVPVDPSDINYERQAYFQFNRYALDTNNTSDSLSLDGRFAMDSAITSIKFGYRFAERSFEQLFWQNPNREGNFPSTLAVPGEDPRIQLNVHRILVNPESNTDPDIRAASEFLQTCLQSDGDTDFLSSDPSNLPRTWTSTTGCSQSQLETAFNLIPLRAINPATGIGYYERPQDRYLVEEKTHAFYGMADFEIGLFNLPVFGNFGVRYVETTVDSEGLADTSGNGEYDLVAFDGDYDDILPSLNANMALTDEMLLRFAVSRTMRRPDLDDIAPRLTLDRSEAMDGYDGTGQAGDPNLPAVHSDNIDLSYEWYYQKGSLFSAAVFFKDIDATVAKNVNQFDYTAPTDEVFLVRSPGELPGTELQGVELALSHQFSNLEGWLGNTGLGVNYTFTDEESEIIDSEGDQVTRQGLSRNSANFSMFYDDSQFSIRLAYNWREAFVTNPLATLENRANYTRGPADSNLVLPTPGNYRIPVIESGRGQWDLSTNYQLTDDFKVMLSIVNLNDAETERYYKYPSLIRNLSQGGRRVNLGVNYKF